MCYTNQYKMTVLQNSHITNIISSVSSSLPTLNICKNFKLWDAKHPQQLNWGEYHMTTEKRSLVFAKLCWHQCFSRDLWKTRFFCQVLSLLDNNVCWRCTVISIFQVVNCPPENTSAFLQIHKCTILNRLVSLYLIFSGLLLYSGYY